MKTNTYINNKTMLSVVEKLLVFLKEHEYVSLNKHLREDALNELITNSIVSGYEDELRKDELVQALGVVFNAYPDKVSALTKVLNKESKN